MAVASFMGSATSERHLDWLPPNFIDLFVRCGVVHAPDGSPIRGTGLSYLEMVRPWAVRGRGLAGVECDDWAADPAGTARHGLWVISSAYFVGNSTGPIAGGAIAATIGINWVFAVTGALLAVNFLWGLGTRCRRLRISRIAELEPAAVRMHPVSASSVSVNRRERTMKRTPSAASSEKLSPPSATRSIVN